MKDSREEHNHESQLPWYAIAIAIVVVGLAALKVPLSTLLVPLALLACPLMMIFMMRSMHDGNRNGDRGHGGHAGCGHQAAGPPAQPRHEHDEHSNTR